MKIILLAGVMMFGLRQSVWAYALGGPIGNGGDAWQVPTIGYGLNLIGDLNAPKNLGEEYRRNTPVMYYAFNANFLDYFGSNGVVAVDSAFTILNNTFTNNPQTGQYLTNGVDSMSKFLSEYPLETRHINYQAQALAMYDLKSATLGELVEQLGLTDPVRYAWTLHDRYLLPGTTCPAGEEYLVVQRNFDYLSSPLNQLQYSPYVNDTLYSYQILEYCTVPRSPIPPMLAIASPFAADPLADTYSPVASSGTDSSLQAGLGFGYFYTGLTRDDVAGLRYLLQTNNINWETASPDSQLLTTNISPTRIIISTLDLGVLSASSLTNDPVTLLALFPNLLITSVTTNFAVMCTPNVVSYLTNFIGAPVGTIPTFIIKTNGSNCFYQPIYTYTFANVITNTFSTSSQVKQVTISLGNKIGAPVGTLVTNVTSTSIVQTNVNSGSYFIVPVGDCGLNIITNSAITNGVTMTTNVITAATNATTGFVDSQSIVTTFTNRQYLAYPVICGTLANATGLYQGIEKINFVKSSFDSLLGQYFQPITNYYTMFYVTNSQVQLQHFQRVVTAPDFLFSAADLASGPNAIPVVLSFTRNLNFDTANVLPGLAGPGTIIPSTTITFDKVGPVYFNAGFDTLNGTPYFTETPGGDISDLFYAFYFVWGSFDGSTNAPVVYPNGTSIDNLENQILIQVSPTSVPKGTNGVVYPPTTFTATGGSFTQPYTWSATGLPLGLSIMSNPDSTAILFGTPAQSGTNIIFTLTLTDYLARSVQWNYPITIQ